MKSFHLIAIFALGLGVIGCSSDSSETSTPPAATADASPKNAASGAPKAGKVAGKKEPETQEWDDEGKRAYAAARLEVRTYLRQSDKEDLADWEIPDSPGNTRMTQSTDKDPIYTVYLVGKENGVAKTFEVGLKKHKNSQSYYLVNLAPPKN